MASSVTNYLQKNGTNPLLKFSCAWVCDYWHNGEAVVKQLQVSRTHIKDRKGIIWKMLGICLEAAYQDRKERDKREQDLKKVELLESLQTEQLQKEVQQERKEEQKLGERVEMMLM